jgi:hypothetical protein
VYLVGVERLVRRDDNPATLMYRLCRNSGSLCVLEPEDLVQACAGIALPLPLPSYLIVMAVVLRLLYSVATILRIIRYSDFNIVQKTLY